MAARKAVFSLLMAIVLSTGCAGASKPIASKIPEAESGDTVYRYAPLKGKAGQANTAKYRKTMESLNAAIQKDHADANSLKRRGVLFAEAGQFAKAEKDYEDALDLLKLRPDSSAKTALVSELHMHRALVKRERGDKNGALADLRVAIEMVPQYWEPRFHRWQLNRELGKTADANADHEAGMKLLPRVFAQNYDSNRGIL